jgi:hypothetical protein
MAEFIIPAADALFFTWQGIMIGYATSYYSVWGVPAQTWADVTAQQAVFEEKYAAAENPATRTSAAVLAKNEARSNYEKALRLMIKAYITYNPAVTDEDRKQMGLPIHKSGRTPSPVPVETPDFSIHPVAGSRPEMHFHAHDEDREQVNAKPAGVHGVEIAWAVLDAPPASYADLVHSVFNTRSPYTFQFDLSDAGKRFYCSPLGKHKRRKRTVERDTKRDYSVVNVNNKPLLSAF